MNNRLFCNRARPRPVIKFRLLAAAAWLGFGLLAGAPLAHAGGDAPQWMHALVNAPLPAHDAKTDAVVLYSETNVTVVSADKIRTQVRKVYKILRPNGREHGTVYVVFRSPGEKVTSLHGWCIPAQGKDYEVKDKDAVEMAPSKTDGAELMTDIRAKVIQIPASDPGNIVGYEYEEEEQPLVLQENWIFQREDPVRESHYSVQLPAGWEYKAVFMNYPEVKPTQGGHNQWQWSVSDVKEIRPEDDMPPMNGVAGKMMLSFFPPGGPSARTGFSNWHEMGIWYWMLANDRSNASPELKQKVAELTAPSATPVDKMRALAQFVQHDIRYVAIELGIGGFQPHAATDVFNHHYGDCKDKATLMRSMLREIGVESYLVIINTERGSITPDMPANTGFDHAIIAIKLPDGLNDPSLMATVKDAKLGKLLFFDPTSELTPFGQIRGHLQSNWGLVVTSDGGQLMELPKQAAATNGIQRTGKLTLNANGTLIGDVQEVRVGDRAWSERWALRKVTNDADRIKPIEHLLADSLSYFQITKATIQSLNQTNMPFGFNYSFASLNYATAAGDLLLVRPRVLGTKAEGLLETKEPRKFPVEFEGPVRDTDTFEIALPSGYVVDDLPPPVDADVGFASYHSKSEVKGNSIIYTRDFEVKELSVPVSKAAELKNFYRIIASDERNTAVLKPVGK